MLFEESVLLLLKYVIIYRLTRGITLKNGALIRGIASFLNKVEIGAGDLKIGSAGLNILRSIWNLKVLERTGYGLLSVEECEKVLKNHN